MGVYKVKKASREIFEIKKNGKKHGTIAIEEDGILSFYESGVEIYNRKNKSEIRRGKYDLTWAQIYDLVMKHAKKYDREDPDYEFELEN